MNITLTLNYVQRIEMLYILYRYSNTVFAIRRFNDAKDGDAFLFQPDCKVCASHIRYLFICSDTGPGELRHAADALRQSL